MERICSSHLLCRKTVWRQQFSCGGGRRRCRKAIGQRHVGARVDADRIPAGPRGRVREGAWHLAVPRRGIPRHIGRGRLLRPHRCWELPRRRRRRGALLMLLLLLYLLLVPLGWAAWLLLLLLMVHRGLVRRAGVCGGRDGIRVPRRCGAFPRLRLLRDRQHLSTPDRKTSDEMPHRLNAE